MSVADAHAQSAAFDCVINPSLVVKLGSPTASILDSVAVERGDHVTKGQVVAQLESSVEAATVALDKVQAESDADIQSKQAVLDEKRATLERKTALEQKNFGSVEDVDTARADFEVAQQDVALSVLNRRVAGLELRRAQAALDLLTIRSPIDGIVVERALGPGEYVPEDAYIVSVARIDPLNVETYLPVAYYGQVRIGDTADVRPADPIGGDHKAVVSVVDQVADVASGTFGVRLSLPNPDDSMPAGFRCRVTFDLSLHPARPVAATADAAGQPQH